MPIKDATDIEIIEGIRLGNRKAFEHLFHLYYTPLKSYARFILKNPSTAEEMVQELFLKLWETHSTIKISTSLKAYLFRAVHNQCINYIKSARVNLRLSEEAIKEMNYHANIALQNFSEEQLEMLATAELETHLDGVIEQLPPQCREIFLLNRHQDLSYSQIAQKMGITNNTVKTQIMRALDRLREAYRNFK